MSMVYAYVVLNGTITLVLAYLSFRYYLKSSNNSPLWKIIGLGIITMFLTCVGCFNYSFVIADIFLNARNSVLF